MLLLTSALFTLLYTLYPPTRIIEGSPQQQAGQNVSQHRAASILDAFNKTEYVRKEMYGIRREKYKQMRSEPVVRPRLSDYAGEYGVQGQQYAIDIAPSGEVSGYDLQGSSMPRRFRLLGAQLSSGLLTGTKVYEGGPSVPFEGLFIEVFETDGTSPANIIDRSRMFALGVAGVHVEIGGVSSNKLLYVLQR
jgi:hypothetical protein